MQVQHSKTRVSVANSRRMLKRTQHATANSRESQMLHSTHNWFPRKLTKDRLSPQQPPQNPAPNSKIPDSNHTLSLSLLSPLLLLLLLPCIRPSADPITPTTHLNYDLQQNLPYAPSVRSREATTVTQELKPTAASVQCQ